MSNYYSGEKKPSFFSTHIKLITFLSVILVFLLVFGSIFVMNAKEWFSGDTRPNMTRRDLIALSRMELESGISIDSVTRYESEENKSSEAIEVVLEVEEDFTVKVYANPNTRLILSGVLINNKRNETRDLFNDDINQYFDYLDKLAQVR